jgi:hypothetical protein
MFTALPEPECVARTADSGTRILIAISQAKTRDLDQIQLIDLLPERRAQLEAQPLDVELLVYAIRVSLSHSHQHRPLGLDLASITVLNARSTTNLTKV